MLIVQQESEKEPSDVLVVFVACAPCGFDSTPPSLPLQRGGTFPLLCLSPTVSIGDKEGLGEVDVGRTLKLSLPAARVGQSFILRHRMTDPLQA